MRPSTAPEEAAARRRQVDAHLGPVERIAVFRALGLGDLLCATPALRALRQRFAQAHISLVGQPWAEALAERLPSINGFIAFPGHPSLPESPPDAQAAWPAFCAAMQARRPDLVVQLHGSGRLTNGLVTQWGARRTAAFHEPPLPAPDPTLAVPWPTQGTETQRLMKLIEVFGEPASGLPTPAERWRLDFPLRVQDIEAALHLLASRGWHPGAARLVCVHLGSQLPSRRWPLSRFAEVACALAEQGHVLALTGVRGERALGETLQAALKAAGRPPCIDLIGETTLWSLGAVIREAALLVCNDTGVSHVAAALGTPSVVISCGSDVSRWAPADAGRHRVLWADEPCRPCVFPECPHDHACAWDVSAASVLDAAQCQLAARA